jgi:hypothetical protein
MTCCCTMNSIMLVVSGATSAVSPETNIIWNTCSVSTSNLHPKRECFIVEDCFRGCERMVLEVKFPGRVRCNRGPKLGIVAF